MQKSVLPIVLRLGAPRQAESTSQPAAALQDEDEVTLLVAKSPSKSCSRDPAAIQTITPRIGHNANTTNSKRAVL